MAHDIQTGTILFREGPFFPETLDVESERYTDAWRLVIAPQGRRLEEKIRATGWTFFFHAELASATVLGSRGAKTTGRALKRTLVELASEAYRETMHYWTDWSILAGPAH